ncbi:hypothetical protein OPT61_g7831 [Boeremia exigua]|uniref:Uncharacterized protein n=1 Tax=Boeremia exigua TaxID=749465 RepID=A0ACC2I0S3_9PLEO|nr:hypothetical protein OPT61_g7831 [Boeremia exigua]
MSCRARLRLPFIALPVGDQCVRLRGEGSRSALELAEVQQSSTDEGYLPKARQAGTIKRHVSTGIRSMAPTDRTCIDELIAVLSPNQQVAADGNLNTSQSTSFLDEVTQLHAIGKIQNMFDNVESPTVLTVYGMGSGKSRIIHTLMNEDPIILIVLVSLVDLWTDILRTEATPQIDFVVYDKSSGSVTDITNHELVLTTFEQVQRAYNTWEKTTGTSSHDIRRNFSLITIAFSHMFADEAGAITNAQAQSSQNPFAERLPQSAGPGIVPYTEAMVRRELLQPEVPEPLIKYLDINSMTDVEFRIQEPIRYLWDSSPDADSDATLESNTGLDRGEIFCGATQQKRWTRKDAIITYALEAMDIQDLKPDETYATNGALQRELRHRLARDDKTSIGDRQESIVYCNICSPNWARAKMRKLCCSTRIDGDVSHQDRAKIMDDFKDVDNPTNIHLMLAGCGELGLD